MATIASLNIALSADSARLKRDLDRAGKQSQTWATKQKARFNSVGKSMGGMRTALAGVGAALGVGKLVAQADALGKNAKAAGLSVEAYQRLQFGLGQAGVSQAGFEKGQLKLNKVFADAGDGLAASQEVLASIGMTYEDLAAMAPEDRMLAVADALAGVEDVGLRAAYTAELLGKEFSKVTLDSDAIRKDGDTISVVTQESADAAAASADSFARLGKTMSNLTTNILIPLMDTLTPVIESISEFATENPMMTSVIAGIVALGVAISVTSLPLVALIAAVAGGIAIFQNWDKIMEKINDFLEGTFGTNLEAIGAKFTPVVDALKAIGGIYIGGIKEVWDIIKMIFEGDWEGLKTKFYNIFSNIGALITSGIKAALNVGVAAIEGILNGVLGRIGAVIDWIPGLSAPSSISLPRFATGGWVSGPGTGTSDSIPALLSNGEFVVNAQAAKDNAKFLENINSGGNTISSGSGGGGSSEKSEGMQSFMDTFQGGLSKAFRSGSFKGFLGDLLDNFTGTIIDSFTTSLTDSLFKDLDFGSLFSGIGSMGGGVGGFLSGIFGFADGGIVPTTSTSKSYADSVPAMLQPGELVVPKDQVGNFMNGGGGGGQVFNINVTGDVSRLTRKEIVQMMPQIAAGTNALNKENGRR